MRKEDVNTEEAKKSSALDQMMDRRRMQWVGRLMVLHFRHFSAVWASHQKDKNSLLRKPHKNFLQRFVPRPQAAPQEVVMATRQFGIRATRCNVSLRPKVTRSNLPSCYKPSTQTIFLSSGTNRRRFR